MVRKVVLEKSENRLQCIPIFLSHMPTRDVSKFNPSQLEQRHRSRIEIKIPCLAIMVYVGYCLFSSCGILTSNRELYEVLVVVWDSI